MLMPQYTNGGTIMSTKKTLYPTFLNKKIDRFSQRLEREWRGRHIMRGRIPDKNAIQLTSNDYLSIANHPEILEAQSEMLNSEENCLLMSAIFQHGNNPQIRFEQRMAEFLDAEEIVLCQSGYNANTGLIQSIIEDTKIPVYIDMFAHMSLWDGARFSDVPIHAFRHNNVQSMTSLILQYGPGIILVDSIYSTDGSVCPLKVLVEAAYALDCIIIVDESHSLGIHGPSGKGIVVELGLVDKVMFRTASLAKAFAGRAGLITCPKGFADYFKFTAKPSIFSSALLPHEIAGLDKTLDLVINGDGLRKRLHYNADYLRKGLSRNGYNVSNSQSQIIALESGTEWQTIILRDALEKHSVFGSVFCAPATAKNRAMIRFSVNASLSKMQLKHIERVCQNIVGEVALSSWKSTNRTRSSAKCAEMS